MRLTAILCATLFTAFATAAPALTLEEIELALADTKTEAQKDRFWRQSENLPLEIAGKVTGAEEAGIILPAIITLEVKGSNFTVECWLRETEAEKAFDVSIGDKVTCSGVFQTYGEIFGKSVVVGSATVKAN